MKNEKLINVLSMLIIVLALLSALTGVLSNEVKEYADVTTSFGETVQLYQKGLYARDSVSVASQAIAQDIVTLIFGIPFLFVALILLKKQKEKGLFLLTGTIGYFLYTYMSYSFVLMYNPFYLIYVTLMALSFYDFILCIMAMYKYDLKRQFTDKFPVKSLSIFLYISGLMVGFMWLGRILPTLISGTAPYGLEHYSTLGIQTLDLGFIVPACFLTAYLLGKEKQWGYLLSIVLVIKMVTMTGAVSAMTVSMNLSGISVSIAEMLMFPILLLICIIFMIKIFKEIKV